MALTWHVCTRVFRDIDELSEGWALGAHASHDWNLDFPIGLSLSVLVGRCGEGMGKQIDRGPEYTKPNPSVRPCTGGQIILSLMAERLDEIPRGGGPQRRISARPPDSRRLHQRARSWRVLCEFIADFHSPPPAAACSYEPPSSVAVLHKDATHRPSRASRSAKCLLFLLNFE